MSLQFCLFFPFKFSVRTKVPTLLDTKVTECITTTVSEIIKVGTFQKDIA